VRRKQGTTTKTRRTRRKSEQTEGLPGPAFLLRVLRAHRGENMLGSTPSMRSSIYKKS
jgi:hypothetical protein